MHERVQNVSRETRQPCVENASREGRKYCSNSSPFLEVIVEILQVASFFARDRCDELSQARRGYAVQRSRANLLLIFVHLH